MALRGLTRAAVIVVVLCASLGPAPFGPSAGVRADDLPPVDAVAGATAYVPVGPARLADTRRGDCGCTKIDASTVRVQVAGRSGVPAEARAAALTVTIAEARSDGGYVTIWPSGSPRSETSVVNFAQGQARANSALVRLGDGGSVDVFVHGGAQLIVDVSGAFVPADVSAAGRLVTLETAQRVLDTRQPGQGGVVDAGAVLTVPLPDGVPADALGLAVNVTTSGTSAGLGYVTAWPAAQQRPESSLLVTDGAGQDRAALAIVPVSADGLSLFTHAGGHLIVDVVGWFTGSSAATTSDGLFVPLTPGRVTDTRSGASPLLPGSAICADVGEGAAAAVNVTITETWAAGYLTGWAAGTPMPSTSNVNATRSHETVANAMIARRSASGIAVYGSAGTDVLIDVAGWFTGSPAQEGSTTLAAPSSDALARPTDATSSDVCGAGDRGYACAGGLDDADLTAFFSAEHGGLYGADYQRATKLPDGRVLWLFQDAMVRAANGTIRLVHNAALMQSGRCFTLVTGGSVGNPFPWIGANDTQTLQHWWWPMGSAIGDDGQLHIFSMEMVERGDRYLANPEPVATWVTSVRLDDLSITRFAPAPDAGTRLYGWSVTSDDDWTYLYGNCNRQFGWTPEGHDPCTANVYLARVPKGQPLAYPEYRTAGGWSTNDASAVPVITPANGRPVNPTQVHWDGTQFLAVTKDSDWFGTDVDVERAPNAWGPWTTYDSIVPPAKCGGCNTYFASWVPWRNADGSLIIGLSHNRWNGALTPAYRPSFLTVAFAPPV